MTIPSRPAPPPPTQQQHHQQQQQQQHNVGGFNNITTTSHIGIIKLPPPPTSLNKKSYQCNSNIYDKTTTSSFRSTASSSSTVSSSSSSSSSITRKFPIAKTRNINGTVQSYYNDPFEITSNTVENSINMKKKIPPPRPPPPKQSINNYGAIDTVLKKPGGPPQSISKLTNIFGKKKNNNTKTFGKQNFQQQHNQQQQIYQQQQLPPNKFTPLSTNASIIKSNSSYQSRPYAFVPPLIRNNNETELISFDSPPNSPSLKKSNSDCNSVNSYSSATDSNFGSPNTGSLATQSAESGFEDDFVSPPDPWESLLSNDPFKDSNDFKNISQPVRNLNTINNLKGDDLLSNGKSLLPPPSTLAMPTIIKPKTSSSSSLLQSSSSLSSQKRNLAPKPPIYLQKPGGEPEELLEADESILNDSSPPMPNCPPPPPPLEVFNSINTLTVDEVPQWINNDNANDNDDDSTDPSQTSYGIALYTFDGLEEGDLPFKENEKVYILDKLNENWYFGRNKRGCEGIFPSNYIQIKVPFKKNPNQNDNNSTIRECIDNMNNDNNQKNHHQNHVLNCKGRSLYNFVAEVPEDLSLNENDIINVLYRINDDWLYGEIGNRKGQFPANFIEFI